MNELMMYGLAATMIVFIATITAGIILGTGVALASLWHSFCSTRQASAVASARAEQGVAEGSI